MRLTLAVCLLSGLAEAQPAFVNVSRDLTRLGIAAQNMTPNSPSLDSRPLLESALQYAQANSIPTIIADPGSYYFLTGHANGRFLSFGSLRNQILDFNGSDLYFASGNWIGIECDGCNNVQFKNFSLDAVQLPFTQVRVTSVDSGRARISYATIDGWEPAANFTAIRNPFSEPEPLYAFAFRNGSPLRSTGRMVVQRPVDPSFLTLASDGSAWSDPKQISSIQPGDVIVLTARAGGPALAIRNSANISISNVSIYAGGGAGLVFESCTNCTIDQAHVIPRPATDRLISSNGEGISAPQVGHDTGLRRSRIRRTGGDGISVGAKAMASVTGIAGFRQVGVARSEYGSFPNGTLMQFIDSKTGLPALTAHVVNQTPPFLPILPGLGSLATLTLDQDIPAIANGDPVVYADTSLRGAGLVVENNLAEDVLHGRGLSLYGLLAGSIQANVFRNLAWNGIGVMEQNSGPAANIVLSRNVVEQFSTAFGSPAAGAIQTEADDLNSAPIAGTPLQNISIQKNLVSSGPSSAIRIANLNGGAVNGNISLNIFSNPQPLFVAASANVNTDGNLIDTTSTSSAIAAAASGLDQAVAPNSWAKITGTKLAPASDLAMSDPLPTNFDGVTVVITDAAGTIHFAPILFVSDQQINFLIPPDCALGAAGVEVINNGSTATRAGMLVDSIAPALFSVDGSGSGTALGSALLFHSDGTYDAAPLTQPINLGASDDSPMLVLYASGIRNRSSLDHVVVYFNNERLPAQFAGDQGTSAGLDQINIPIPQSWRGAGAVKVRVVVDGISSNVVGINIQ